ncbi:hypothetical protein P43SY_005355 [Pythium insidiosum]|uniref:Uncharacterized protein n=1 Tax=Pythium insidiosum TaxID=114742 RepID=A0AAD5LNG4_PYTIN|nr:hypothetical protein P43SY_005355 [Pythium insidiosum]
MELTEDLIKRRSKHFDLGQLKRFTGLRCLASLDGCKSLLHLDLTGNQLRDLSGLPALPLLQSLGLSRNKIRTLADLPQLPLLEELVVKENQVDSVDFVALARCMLHINPSSDKRASLKDEVSLRSGATSKDMASFKIPTLDVDAFVATTTQRLDALLRDAELTLDHETANVQRAFMLEQALSPA